MNNLEKIIEYKFNNIEHLKLALTHSSLMKNGVPVENNERLEFLGDSILSATISTLLFNKHKKYKEGELTLLKNFLVKKDSLAYIGEKFELKKYLKAAKKLKINDAMLENTLEAIIGAIFLDSDFYICNKVVVSWFEKYFSDQLNSDRSFKDPITSLKEISDKLYKEPSKYKLISQKELDKQLIFEIEVSVGSLKAVASATSKKKAREIASAKLLKMIKYT